MVKIKDQSESEKRRIAEGERILPEIRDLVGEDYRTRMGASGRHIMIYHQGIMGDPSQTSPGRLSPLIRTLKRLVPHFYLPTASSIHIHEGKREGQFYIGLSLVKSFSQDLLEPMKNFVDDYDASHGGESEIEIVHRF